jgi:hypothetical protein
VGHLLRLRHLRLPNWERKRLRGFARGLLVHGAGHVASVLKHVFAGWAAHLNLLWGIYVNNTSVAIHGGSRIANRIPARKTTARVDVRPRFKKGNWIIDRRLAQLILRMIDIIAFVADLKTGRLLVDNLIG